MNDEAYLKRAGKVAQQATCNRARCGTVIVNDDAVIGEGWNGPPGGRVDQRRCDTPKATYHQKVTDKTCCVHAEQRAIMDALRRHPDVVKGSTLYFMRVDDHGDLTRAGKPYCTVCSKMALDAGVDTFVLWHDDGIRRYDTATYNELSYQYEP